jgi:hypothetical protein
MPENNDPTCVRSNDDSTGHIPSLALWWGEHA